MSYNVQLKTTQLALAWMHKSLGDCDVPSFLVRTTVPALWGGSGGQGLH